MRDNLRDSSALSSSARSRLLPNNRALAPAHRTPLALALLLLGLGGSPLLRTAQPPPPRPAVETGERSIDPRATPADADLVVRLFYGDRERLAQLVGRYDVFEYANHEEGYVVARLRSAEYQELRDDGYRLDIDDALTAQLNLPLRRSPAQSAGIPGFPCYRTVEETYAALVRIAAQCPALASLIDIGDSWEKAHSGGQRGYDLLVLVLSNQTRPGPKPRLFLMAEHHARELATAETATRFAEELVSRYDVDPDVTWLLDYSEVHILPLANPDGRKWAEQGQWWRKNTANTNGCTAFPSYGTDLNRNCGFLWGGLGSSSHACDEVYRGPAPFSEPENQAIRDYVRSLFPDQRGPEDNDPAPSDATGLVISLHSYGELILFPWGWTTNAAPNGDALRTLGGKFAFFSRYAVQPSHALYPTTGSADEWAYGELGVAAYTFEIGTSFFEPCSTFEGKVYPANRQALDYAVKACRQPYQIPAGPDVLQPSISPAGTLAGVPVALAAVADASRCLGSAQPPPARTIAAARYSIDEPSWVEGVVTHALAADDGNFDSARENIGATIDTKGWTPGRHTLFLEAQSAAGDWGVPTALFVWIAPVTLTGAMTPAGFVLEWPSVSNSFYTVLRWDAVGSPASVLLPSLPATPPTNSVLDTRSASGARFYRVFVEP